jgi:proline iminopeptidase
VRAITLVVSAVAVIAAACAEPKPRSTDTAPPAEPGTSTALPAGESMFAVPGGRIWYRKSGAGTATPIILLHGGPGFSSYYLKSLEALGDERPVIRYDQLGGGKSDRITDTTLFTIAHFVRELDSLRAALGYSRMHLLGHSWGTILAFEYYKVHPERVAGIVFGSAVFDLPAYEKRARSLVATLTDSAQRAIKAAEAAGKFDAPAYQNAVNEFYGKYVFRHPVEADLDSTFKTFNEAIYNYMQGPSEFTITGTLKHYDVTAELRSIKVPALYTVGEFDEVGPELVKRYAAATPDAKYEVIPGSAHITTWDNPPVMLRVVRDFLRGADGGTAAK